jgi:hypothetical protein
MEKPANIKAFIELIESMQHRERFVFDLREDLDGYSGSMCCCLEVYSTDLHKYLGDRTQNILFQTVDISGKFDKKFNVKTSILFRLLRNNTKMQSSMFNLIA